LQRFAQRSYPVLSTRMPGRGLKGACGFIRERLTIVGIESFPEPRTLGTSPTDGGSASGGQGSSLYPRSLLHNLARWRLLRSLTLASALSSSTARLATPCEPGCGCDRDTTILATHCPLFFPTP